MTKAELFAKVDSTWLSTKRKKELKTAVEEYTASRFDSDVFTPPFRLGRKQKRAILDANGIAVIIMPHKSELQAQLYCDYLNDA
jgi:hypothetical protein